MSSDYPMLRSQPRPTEPVMVPGIVALLRGHYRSVPVHATDRRSRENDWAARWRLILFGDPCVYCGGEVETLDHVQPLAHNGGNHWANLTGACRSCNQRKGATPLLLFLMGTTYRQMRRRLKPIKPTVHLSAIPKPPIPQRLGLFAERLAAALGAA